MVSSQFKRKERAVIRCLTVHNTVAVRENEFTSIRFLQEKEKALSSPLLVDVEHASCVDTAKPKLLLRAKASPLAWARGDKMRRQPELLSEFRFVSFDRRWNNARRQGLICTSARRPFRRHLGCVQKSSLSRQICRTRVEAGHR